MGVRHILPVYPFLFVLASRLATIQFRRPLAHAARCCLAPACFLRLRPRSELHPISLLTLMRSLGGPDRGYYYLSDSNLD